MKLIQKSDNNNSTHQRGEIGTLVPICSLPSGMDTRSVGVVTSEGLFPIPGGVRGDVQNQALAQFDPANFGGVTEQTLQAESKAENADAEAEADESRLWHKQSDPIVVELKMQNILLDSNQVGTRTAYNGNTYDPFGPNPGNITMVLEIGDLITITDRNPGRRATDSNAHGAVLVQNIVSAYLSGDFREIQPYLLFLDVLYGEAIDVDYAECSFESVPGTEKAHIVDFFDRKVTEAYEVALTGERRAASSTSGSNGSSGSGSDFGGMDEF